MSCDIFFKMMNRKGCWQKLVYKVEPLLSCWYFQAEWTMIVPRKRRKVVVWLTGLAATCLCIICVKTLIQYLRVRERMATLKPGVRLNIPLVRRFYFKDITHGRLFIYIKLGILSLCVHWAVTWHKEHEYFMGLLPVFKGHLMDRLCIKI